MADKSTWTGAALVRVVSSNWLAEDVGAVGVSGTVRLSDGIFSIQGAGADIWYNADAFRYVFQALSGDCSITARVITQQNTADWAKAGVMIRETLDPSSQYVLNFISPANGAALQERMGSGAAASSVSNNTDLSAPCWLRLVRSGNVFMSFVSADGVSWTPTGSTTVTMSANVYVGLAVSSVKEGILGEAQFDHVSFSTSSAAVISSPLPALIHRWSFNETSSGTAHDSVGGADGLLNGQAYFDGQGRVVLDGTNGSFVNLPGNLLAGLSSVTIEAWVTNAVEPDNVALFSFDDGLQDGVGSGYLRYVLHDQGNSRNFLELASDGESSLIAANPGLGARALHLVCVYDPVNGESIIYTNGVLEKSDAISIPLANVSSNNAALGRSPWRVDPWLNGAIDEFRIFAGPLLPADVVAAQLIGPDVLLATNVSLTVSQGSGSLTLSWPVASSGLKLQSSPGVSTSAAWRDVTPAATIVAGNNQVTVRQTRTPMYFRLWR